MQDVPTVSPTSPEDWEAWLEKNHDKEKGAWLKMFKKHSRKHNLTHQQAIIGGLRFGWIDGVRYKGDDEYFLQRFTPRTKRSPWSKINVGYVGELIKAGRMHAAGMKEVEAAKADGRWDRAYDSGANSAAPEDFLKELKKNKKAFAFYQSLNKANTYAIHYRLQTAKKPETRERRMKLILTMMREGKKFH